MTHCQKKESEKTSFPTSETPPNNFTPLFGELAKLGTLIKKNEQ